MFKNYFAIAIRNFRRNKAFTFINITGLAIGISASLVIYLIVQYDFSFDNFEKDRDRIYRVVSDFNFSGESSKNSGTPEPMHTAVKNELTGIDLIIPFYTAGDDVKVSIPSKKNENPVVYKNQDHIVFAEENYFRLLDYKWITGSIASSLKDPHQVVLTESNAHFYYPKLSNEEITGKEIIFNDSIHAIVSGIVKDIESNTDFNFKTFISRSTLEHTGLRDMIADGWNSTSSSSQLFLKLSPNTKPSKIKAQINALYEKYREKNPEDNSKVDYVLQPLSDIHFNDDYGNFGQRTAHLPTMYGLLAVALFLLLLACINFINLTTAHATHRAKEIGIRKTMGSSRKQLIFQFLSETFLLTFIAAIVSLLITPLLLKVFSDFIPQGLQLDLLHKPDVIVFLVLLAAMVSFLSGLYPAIILSGYKPAFVLKNQAYTTGGLTRNAWFRKALTISQFTIAQVFIIATIIVGRQINFSLNKDMGFKKDAILHFSANDHDTSVSNKNILLEKLKAIPGVAMISLSNNPLSGNSSWTSTMNYRDSNKKVETDVQVKLGDTNYVKIFHLKLLAGTNFPNSDTVHEVIINEAYAKTLGFKNPREAIGKYIEWDNKQDPVVAVVADFNFRSIHEPVKPLIIGSKKSSQRCFNVALMSEDITGIKWTTTINKIQHAWTDIYPQDDFEYSFFDEDIVKYYTAEKNISALLIWSTGLTIFISCLGLLGLVMYITNQRTKEIGIRKVVGASIIQIIALLSKDFLKLVFVAFLVAVPFAWYGSNKWLENFAYKTSLSWWIFMLGGLIMLLISLVILSMRTFKAAAANPVKSLRME